MRCGRDDWAMSQKALSTTPTPRSSTASFHRTTTKFAARIESSRRSKRPAPRARPASKWIARWSNCRPITPPNACSRAAKRCGNSSAERRIDPGDRSTSPACGGGRRARQRNRAPERGGWGKSIHSTSASCRGTPTPTLPRKRGRGGALPLPQQINPISTSALMAYPRRGRMARHLEPLAGIGELAAVDLQDGEILGDIISGQKIFAVGREHDRLGQAADLDILGLGHLLAVDLEHRKAAVLVVVEGLLHVRAAQDRGDRDVALRRHGKSLRAVADH